MGGGSRVDDQALHVSNVSQQAENLQVVNERMSFLNAALDLEGEDGSTTVGEVLLVQRMVRVIRQAGMVDLFHLRVVGKVFHDLFGVLGMALHAQAQSLNTLQ